MFADQLVAIRKTLGLSQKEFSAAIGVESVNAWELGRCLPNFASCKLLEEFFKKNNIDYSALRNEYRIEYLRATYDKSCPYTWNEGFKRLSQYLQENDAYPPVTSALGLWVSQQRKNYVQHRFSEKHIQMLESIGFQWKADDETEAQEWVKVEWMKHYNNVLQRIKDTGEMPNDQWITQQLKLPHTEEEQKLLDELGIRMVPGSMIREARGNISQQKLATALGVSTDTVHHWEHHKVREYKLWAILKVINNMK